MYQSGPTLQTNAKQRKKGQINMSTYNILDQALDNFSSSEEYSDGFEEFIGYSDNVQEDFIESDWYTDECEEDEEAYDEAFQEYIQNSERVHVLYQMSNTYFEAFLEYLTNLPEDQRGY